MPRPPFSIIEAPSVLGRAVALALDHLSRAEIAGFWVHLDADVLDDAVMPAVDYRMPGGLSWTELVTVVQAAVTSDRAVGMDVTIFNPRLDVEGSVASAFVDALAKAVDAWI